MASPNGTPRAAAFETLRIDRMSRSFGAHNALHEVDLTIRRGEFIALLGPSGCGKSTALNCIAGLLSPTGGEIRLDDRRIDTLRPEQRGFGMVFQNYALFPHMDVRRNVGFGLRMRGVAKAEAARRVEEALALVRLQSQAAKLPGQLSGGQQQRVAIARAVVIEPPLVLMDEPLSNLDAKLRLEMRAEIRRIHQTLGATTLYVTHDQDEAMSLADRVVVLRDGRVRQVGTPAELYERPDHLDVAEFMGFRNRIPGVAGALENGVLTVQAGCGTVLEAFAQGSLPAGSPAVVAVRPDDLEDGPPGPGAIAAVVDSIEYRGREFVGIAHATDGTELVFRSGSAAAPGAAVHLRIAAGRGLAYSPGPANTGPA